MSSLTFDEILEGSTPAEREVPLCLNGNLRAKHERLSGRIEALIVEAAESEKEEADGKADTRMGKRGKASALRADADKLSAELATLEIEIRRYVVVFVLKAISPQKFNKMFSEHAPRIMADGKRDPRDVFGVNAETFFPLLIKACLAEPVMTEARWAKLLDKLSDVQYDKLAGAAWLVNRQEEDIPFSLAE